MGGNSRSGNKAPRITIVPQAKNTEEGSKEGSQEACSYETSSQKTQKKAAKKPAAKKPAVRLLFPIASVIVLLYF